MSDMLSPLMDGVLLINKPIGITSHTCLHIVRKQLGQSKAGHTGTLDPLATGLLPLCLGEATKFSRFLLDAAKAYRVTVVFGAETDTGDSTGQVIDTAPVPKFTESELLDTLNAFIGTQLQIPPMYSALKVRGKKLYEYARKGQHIEREPREITIQDIELLSFDDDTLSLNIHCSKGTYVRTLVSDIAKALGTLGHVVALHRVEVGHFSVDNAISIEQLKAYVLEDNIEAINRFIMPINTLLQDWKSVILSDEAVLRLKNGQVLSGSAEWDYGWVSIYAENGQFIGVGEHCTQGSLYPRRMMSTVSL